MMSLILGLLTAAIGGYGIYHWLGDSFILLKGLIPLSFICGGLLAVLAGISSLKK